MTPSTPMQYLINRLRAALSDANQFSDDDLLGFLNDGYQAACERSRCIRTAATISLVAGQQEYSLPADWVSTLSVYMNGRRMVALPVRIAPEGSSTATNYSYSFGSTLGLVTTPQVDGTLILYYAQEPARLAIGDTPDPQFPPERYYLLRHYAAWQVYLNGYGAEALPRAIAQRNLFDTGAAMLERWVTSKDRVQGAARVQTLISSQAASNWVTPPATVTNAG